MSSHQADRTKRAATTSRRGRRKNAGQAASVHPGTPPAEAARGEIIQFNWRRHWRTKVEPYLDLPLVRGSVECAMKSYDRNWTWDDVPHAIGRGWLNGQRVVKGKLSWYQPWGRCHSISFFACAIGVLNYSDLDWQFVSGLCHTVPVGSQAGVDRVVMDILNFERMTAEESIALAQRTGPGAEGDAASWSKVFTWYLDKVVPRLRELARAGQRSG